MKYSPFLFFDIVWRPPLARPICRLAAVRTRLDGHRLGPPVRLPNRQYPQHPTAPHDLVDRKLERVPDLMVRQTLQLVFCDILRPFPLKLLGTGQLILTLMPVDAVLEKFFIRSRLRKTLQDKRRLRPQ